MKGWEGSHPNDVVFFINNEHLENHRQIHPMKKIMEINQMVLVRQVDQPIMVVINRLHERRKMVPSRHNNKKESQIINDFMPKTKTRMKGSLFSLIIDDFMPITTAKSFFSPGWEGWRDSTENTVPVTPCRMKLLYSVTKVLYTRFWFQQKTTKCRTSCIFSSSSYKLLLNNRRTLLDVGKFSRINSSLKMTT